MTTSETASTAGTPSTPDSAESPSTHAPDSNADASAEDADPAEEQDGAESPNAEAAKYRTRLREAESRVAALTEHVTALQKQIVEGQLGAHGLKPAAFWATTPLADGVDEDGTVDAAKVHEAIRAAADTLGVQIGLHVPGEGNFPSGPGKPSGRDQWDQAFLPPVKR